MVGGRGWGVLGTEIGATGGGRCRATAGGIRAVSCWPRCMGAALRPGGERAVSDGDSWDMFSAAIGAT